MVDVKDDSGADAKDVVLCLLGHKMVLGQELPDGYSSTPVCDQCAKPHKNLKEDNNNKPEAFYHCSLCRFDIYRSCLAHYQLAPLERPKRGRPAKKPKIDDDSAKNKKFEEWALFIRPLVAIKREDEWCSLCKEATGKKISYESDRACPHECTQCNDHTFPRRPWFMVRNSKGYEFMIHACQIGIFPEPTTTTKLLAALAQKDGKTQETSWTTLKTPSSSSLPSQGC